MSLFLSPLAPTTTSASTWSPLAFNPPANRSALSPIIQPPRFLLDGHPFNATPNLQPTKPVTLRAPAAPFVPVLRQELIPPPAPLQPTFDRPNRHGKRIVKPVVGGWKRFKRNPLYNPDHTSNVYVRLLPPSCTDADLQTLGGMFGPLLSVRALVDSVPLASSSYLDNQAYVTEGGVRVACTGVGFVLYESIDWAQRAIEGLNRMGFDASFARESMTQKLKKLTDPFTTNVYFSNLPRAWSEQHLIQLLAPAEVKSIRLLRDDELTSPAGYEERKPRGVGFARLASREEAQQSIDRLHGVVLQGSYLPLQVRFADSEEQKEFKEAYKRPRWIGGRMPGPLDDMCLPSSTSLPRPQLPTILEYEDMENQESIRLWEGPGQHRGVKIQQRTSLSPNAPAFNPTPYRASTFPSFHPSSPQLEAAYQTPPREFGSPASTSTLSPLSHLSSSPRSFFNPTAGSSFSPRSNPLPPPPPQQGSFLLYGAGSNTGQEFPTLLAQPVTPQRTTRGYMPTILDSPPMPMHRGILPPSPPSTPPPFFPQHQQQQGTRVGTVLFPPSPSESINRRPARMSFENEVPSYSHYGSSLSNSSLFGGGSSSSSGRALSGNDSFTSSGVGSSLLRESVGSSLNSSIEELEEDASNMTYAAVAATSAEQEKEHQRRSSMYSSVPSLLCPWSPKATPRPTAPARPPLTRRFLSSDVVPLSSLHPTVNEYEQAAMEDESPSDEELQSLSHSFDFTEDDEDDLPLSSWTTAGATEFDTPIFCPIPALSLSLNAALAGFIAGAATASESPQGMQDESEGWRRWTGQRKSLP